MAALVVVCLFGCSRQAPEYGPNTKLSDEDIVAFAATQSKASFRRPAQIIGIHNGVRVAAEIKYFDDHATAVGIVHYEVAPGEACKRAGGVVRLEEVPVALASIREPYCVPKVLVDRNIHMIPQ